jgi:hypothetical protein
VDACSRAGATFRRAAVRAPAIRRVRAHTRMCLRAPIRMCVGAPAGDHCGWMVVSRVLVGRKSERGESLGGRWIPTVSHYIKIVDKPFCFCVRSTMFFAYFKYKDRPKLHTCLRLQSGGADSLVHRNNNCEALCPRLIFRSTSQEYKERTTYNAV